MQLQEFLNSSYTAFHATENAKNILKQAGFIELDGVNQKIEVGKKYFVTKNNSAIVAFVVGSFNKLNVVVSHTDSPSLKIKGDKTIVSNGLTRLNVEAYGGGIWRSFLDRKLKIAGRYFTDKGEKLYDSSFNLTIPSLCIHHNIAVNDGEKISIQNHMLPFFAKGEKPSLYGEIFKGEAVFDADLFVVPAEPSYLSGSENEFLCSPRIDNLTSVYGSLKALCDINVNNCDGIALCACLDSEEIGSNTMQGAGSVFLKNVIKSIYKNSDKISYKTALEKSFVLSVDNGHASHPAHSNVSDNSNPVKLGGGVVIKHHSNYATNGKSSAILKSMLVKNKIDFQDYYNNSDIRCGSTVGAIVATQFAVDVCDIGLAQLSMHSAVETVAIEDIEKLQKCLQLQFEGKYS